MAMIVDRHVTAFEKRNFPLEKIRDRNSVESMKYLLIGVLITVILSCNKEHSCEGCDGRNLANQLPKAVASIDSSQNLSPGSRLLTAKFSTDPDGTIVSYKWRKISGPASYTIIDSLALQTLVSNLVQGTYLFELAVTDNGGLTARDTIQVIEQGAPVTTLFRADAGPDQTLYLPLDSTYLDGSGSTPNGFTGSSANTFRWTKIAGPTQHVLNPTSLPVAGLAKTTMIAKNLVPGVYLFILTLTEPVRGSVVDTMKVTVVNDPLLRSAVAYHDLIWEQDPSGVSWRTTFLESSLRPDIFDNAGVNRGVEISLKMNVATPWTVVPFRTHDPLNSDVIQYVAAILTKPNNPLLAGMRSDLRIRF